MNHFARCSTILACTLVFAVFTNGEDQPAAGSTDETDPLVARIEQAVNRYELRWMADEKPLTPTAVLRWKNNPRGQTGIAILVLWTRGGRPVAQASIYPWLGNVVHEFASLVPADAIAAFDDGRTVWSPRKDGVVFRDFDEAPEPADTPAARLRQMKLLAEKFETVMTGWKPDSSDRETLRLLTKELYRYDEQALKQSGATVRDGAVFGFVQGTDPEATLVLQAETVEGQPRWRYAFARATSGGLEASLGGKVVWSVERNYQMVDPNAETFNHREPMDAPSDEIAR
jgi:hypothetical protein